MPLLNTADAVYLGEETVDAMYLDGVMVWPTIAPFNPADLSDLVVWHDAIDYLPGAWPNKGDGAASTIIGTPVMTWSANTLNGLPVVRFKTNEGRLRGAWPTNVHNYTLVYLVRWVGPAAGRAFTALYPPSNMLVGMHTSKRDTMYDNGTWQDSPDGTAWNWTAPGPWRMYGADSQEYDKSRFFIDGTRVGGDGPGAGGGLTNGWGISGYENSTSETIDIEVAELVLYSRRLLDDERVQVEDYLRAKWGL